MIGQIPLQGRCDVRSYRPRAESVESQDYVVLYMNQACDNGVAPDVR